jgi:hypothetical protein
MYFCFKIWGPHVFANHRTSQKTLKIVVYGHSGIVVSKHPRIISVAPQVCAIIVA